MSNKNILLVDDEKDFVDTVAIRLEAKGYDIMRAYSGKEALEKVYAAQPDLIVLDVMMPEMGGFDVCRKLKVDPKYSGIPIIMLTAKFQPSDIEFGKELGAEAYLTKPVKLDELSEKISELLRQKMPIVRPEN